MWCNNMQSHLEPYFSYKQRRCIRKRSHGLKMMHTLHSRNLDTTHCHVSDTTVKRLQESTHANAMARIAAICLVNSRLFVASMAGRIHSHQILHRSSKVAETLRGKENAETTGTYQESPTSVEKGTDTDGTKDQQ